MKFVDTDIEHREDDDETGEHKLRPPRPEHRRVYTSLLLTGSVLVATIVGVYTAFPKRNKELLTVAVEAHAIQGAFDLDAPGLGELQAWTVGVVGSEVPWPTPDEDLMVLGTRQVLILKRPAAMVRYEFAGNKISLVVTKARDSPPRKHRREEGELLVRSWRKGKWTFVVVGPKASFKTWKTRLGVP